MFKFFYYLKYNTHPARIETKARQLVMIGSKQAFRMFKSEDVRRLLDFNKVGRTEQDRFFNEMTVTNIVMLMLILDYKIENSDPDERREYLQAVRAEVPKYYVGFLKRIGIPKEFTKIWQKLIDLRYDEYYKDKMEGKRELMGAKGIKHEIATDNRLMIFQTMAFGLYRHLRRGKVSPKDELYKRTQNFLLPVYKGLVKKAG